MLPRFLDPDRPNRTACLVGGRVVSLGELLARAAALGRAVDERFDPVGRHTTLGFGRNRLDFALGLVGSWSAGRTAMLPEHGRREALGALALHPATGLFVHDTGTGRGLFASPFAADVPPTAALRAVSAPRPEDALWAAGRRPVPGRACSPRPAHPGLGHLGFVGWSFASLETEVDGLVGALGAHCGGPVLSTLAPCYAPAAIAAVLLPLALGLPFVAEVPIGARATVEARRQSGAAVLVTSLEHLMGLWALPPGALEGLRTVLVVGQTLPETVARRFEARHGVAVIGELAREPAPGVAEFEALFALLWEGGAEDAEVARGPAGLQALVVAGESARIRLCDRLVAAGEPGELRLVDRLARDPNGHMTRADFLRHFGLDAEGAPLSLDFPLELNTRGEPRAVLVPRDSAWFEGHFPGYPVLAGAVQLAELVLPALERHLGRKPRVRAWSALKFLAPIQPGDTLRLEFVRTSEHAFDFHIQRGEARCTQGRVHCCPEGEVAP